MNRRKIYIKKAKKRKALHEIMTPGFWRAHHIVPAFIALVGLGMALGVAHFSSMQPYKASAAAADNILGWAWADTIGWISLNDQNPSSCGSPPCGTYGINMAPAASLQLDGRQGHTVNGFVWSDNVGFICFGTSCNIPACRGAFLPSPPGTGFYAYVDPVTDPSPKKVHGWAVVCNEKDLGWISLNCEDTGTCTNPPTPPASYLNYRLVYNPQDHKFFVNPYEGQPAMSKGVPFGWNGNSDGTGFGYISFYPISGSAAGMHLTAPAENCLLVGDEDLNGLADCSDPACSALPQCKEINSINGGLTIQDKYNACHDHVDNDANGQADCTAGSVPALPADTSCLGSMVCQLQTDVPGGCSDGLDNIGNGLIDCADPACAADPACVAPPIPDQPICTDNPACVGLAGEALANCCCNDNMTNGPHPLDCLDTKCQAQAPKVCSAWSKVVTGNIYAQGGISGTQAPKASGTNVKYCLRSSGTIEWTSEASCKEEAAGTINLPTSQTNYRSKLGFLDLAGIRSGRYGEVVTINTSNDLPANLAGKIYRYTGGGTFNLLAKTFVNGSAPINRGNGLLFIDGGDLKIMGDIQYTADPVQSSLRNLASFGAVVVKNSTGAGGNVDIDPAVQKVSGAYFAEGIFSTGSIKTSNPALSDVNLKIYGILVAQQFKLQRNNDNPSEPAEEIIFDGRAVVNPPPGMQDTSKSLPRPDVTF